VLVTDAGIAKLLTQLVDHPFTFRPRRRHRIDEPSANVGEFVVTFASELAGDGMPTLFNPTSSFHDRVFARFGTSVAFQECAGDSGDLRAHVC
jgi:hypothetical protein